MKNKKRYLIFVIIGILILVIGVAYAFFQANLSGSRTIEIIGSDIKFLYREGENDLIIRNATIKDDSSGIEQNEYFDFTVALESNNITTIDYIIYLTKSSESTLDSSYLKIYLTDQEDNEIVSPSSISSLNNYKDANSFIIHKEVITNSSSNLEEHNYRLRTWLTGVLSDEDLNYYENENEQRYVQGGGTYKFKINITTIEDIYLEETPLYCFDYIIDKETSSIRNYLCYEDNTFGYETITDVVIPRLFEGKPLTSIKYTYIYTEEVFYNKGITSVVFPDTITEIGDWTFHANKMTSVVIPDSVTSIGAYTFNGNRLSSIKLSKNLKFIGERAFSYNQLTRVDIPLSVERIDAGAFYVADPISNLYLDTIVNKTGRAFDWTAIITMHSIGPSSVTANITTMRDTVVKVIE